MTDASVLLKDMILLFNYFGWWSLALIAGVTLVMIPINMLYKKLMKKESLERLRKTVAVLTVYGLALAAVALISIFVFKVEVTVQYLFAGAIACGFCSMTLWFIIKFIRDYGWAAIKAMMSKTSWKKDLKQCAEKYGIPKNLANIVLNTVDEYLDKVDSSKAEAVMAKQGELTTQIRAELSGFVKENLTDAVNGIIEVVKTKYAK